MTRTSEPVKTFLNPVDNATMFDMMEQEIELERSDKPNGVLSRWQVINNALMRYWRFRMIYTIAGASGSAKSYFLNQLRYDLTDHEPLIVDVRNIPSSIIDAVEENGEMYYKNGKLIREPLNPDPGFTVLNLHFGFEMHPIFEHLRTISALTGYGHQYLLSSYGQRSEINGIVNYVYNKITDDEMKLIRMIKIPLVERYKNILMFKQPGNREEMYNTVYQAMDKYVRRKNNVKLTVSLDHSLLTKKLDESGDLELQNELIRSLIGIRDDFGAMVVPIIQTNSNMEDSRRRENPNSHYPVKSDLYMGGQFYQGSDFVAVMLQPSSIGIGQYGPRKVPTAELIHWSLIKSRYNVPGQIWLWNNLAKSKIQSCMMEGPQQNEPMPFNNLANTKRPVNS